MKAMSPVGWMILGLALVAFASLASALIFSKTVHSWFEKNPLGTVILGIVSIALGVWAMLAESTEESMAPMGCFVLLWGLFFFLLPWKWRVRGNGGSHVLCALLLVGALLNQQARAARFAGYGVTESMEERVVKRYKVVANSEAEAIEKAKELVLAEYAGSNPRIVEVRAEDPVLNGGQAEDGAGAVFTPAAWWVILVVIIIIIVAAIMVIKIAEFCNNHFPRNQAPPPPGGAGFAASSGDHHAASSVYVTTTPDACTNGPTSTANSGTFQLSATVSTNGSNVTVTGFSYQLTSVSLTTFQNSLLPWGIDFFANPPVEGAAPIYAKNGVPVPAKGHPVTAVGATVTVNNQTGNVRPTATIVLQTSPDISGTNWNTLVTVSGVPGGQQMQFEHVPNSPIGRLFYRLSCSTQP